MGTRTVTINIENVKPGDILYPTDAGRMLAEAVWCEFFHQLGPDPHIVVEYTMGNKPQRFSMKYGRKVPVRRTYQDG